MKLKTEHKLLWGGSFLSLLIIYLTKIDTTPACAQWIYDIGQYFWFNLAIAYLGSILFYLIVVYIPEKRKKKIFVFQMGMDIQMIYLRSWRLFFYLKNASGIEDDINDKGKKGIEALEKMIAIIDLDTVHTFINEPEHNQTFRKYLENYKVEISNSINNALSIPYDDLELSSILIRLQRSSVLAGNCIDKGSNKFSKMDILIFFAQLNQLDCYFDNHFAPIILNSKKKKVKKKPLPISKIKEAKT